MRTEHTLPLPSSGQAPEPCLKRFFTWERTGASLRPAVSRRCAMAVLAAALGCARPELCHALVRYVKPDAAGANNGVSWTNAHVDLQSALAAAASGDEI